MGALLLTVVMASLLGSLHCVGMCGPFVAFYAGADGSGGARRLLSHGVYSGGRLVSYLALGATAGAVGAALDLAGSLAGFHRVAAVLAGAAMVSWGLLALLHLRGVRLFRHTTGGPLARLVRRGFSVVGGKPPLVRAAVVGLLSGLLPCGWLWAFLVTAAGTGTATGGIAVMAAFWLGTVPALVAVGLGAQLVAAPLRRHVPTVTAVLLIALGTFAIVSRPTSAVAAISKHSSSQHQVPDPGTTSCCSTPQKKDSS
jgi:sulfite exporter TauE/SafE